MIGKRASRLPAPSVTYARYHNAVRPHSALGGRTPLEAHAGDEGVELAA